MLLKVDCSPAPSKWTRLSRAGADEICPMPKREALTGCGVVGKATVVGVKDRLTKNVHAKVVENTESKTLPPIRYGAFDPEPLISTDEAGVYESLVNHGSVKHSVSE